MLSFFVINIVSSIVCWHHVGCTRSAMADFSRTWAPNVLIKGFSRVSSCMHF